MKGWDIRVRIINNTRRRNAPSKNQGLKRRRDWLSSTGSGTSARYWKAQSYLRRYRKAARELLALMSTGTDHALFDVKRDGLIGHMQRAGASWAGC